MRATKTFTPDKLKLHKKIKTKAVKRLLTLTAIVHTTVFLPLYICTGPESITEAVLPLTLARTRDTQHINYIPTTA